MKSRSVQGHEVTVKRPLQMVPQKIYLSAAVGAEGIVLTLDDGYGRINSVLLAGEELIHFLDALEDARRDDIEIPLKEI